MAWKSRAIAIGLGLALFLAAVIGVAGPSWAIVSYRLLTDGVMMVLWVLAAAGIGRVGLGPVFGFLEKQKNPHPSPPPEYRERGKEQEGLLAFVTCAATGIGITSLFILGFGLMGWLSHIGAISLEVVGLVLFCRQWFGARQLLNAWLHEPAGIGWLWFAAIPAAAAVALAALVPPGILWGDEPNGYDVVEYHLQVPRQWYDAGRITPLKENVFSYFPQGVEMQYLLAMEIRGGPWKGMYLAQFMHAGMIALAAMAVGAEAGVVGGVVVAVTPWCALLAPMAYVEGGVILYGGLAVIWVLRGMRKDTNPGPPPEHGSTLLTAGQGRGEEGRGASFVLAGVMAGLACDVKLTNIVMLLFVLPVAWVVADRSLAIKRVGLFVAGAGVVLVPWLIRTAWWAGNPVFPEAMNWLGHAHFTLIQMERWRRAYLATTGLGPAVWEQMFGDWRYGFVLLPAGMMAALLNWKRGGSRFLISVLLLTIITWLAFTHLQSRFLILLVPVCAILLGRMGKPRVQIGVVLALMVCGAVQVDKKLTHYLSVDRQMDASEEVGLLGREDLAGMHGPPELPERGRVDLVGDACAFLYQIPSNRLMYRTVFDVAGDDEAKSSVADWLGESDAPRADRLIVVDAIELDRLSRSYYGIKPLGAEELARLENRKDVYVVKR